MCCLSPRYETLPRRTLLDNFGVLYTKVFCKDRGGVFFFSFFLNDALNYQMQNKCALSIRLSICCQLLTSSHYRQYWWENEGGSFGCVWVAAMVRLGGVRGSVLFDSVTFRPEDT